MHAHAEQNEKVRLKEATTIITAGGVTNVILGVAKIGLGNFTGYLPLVASGVHSLQVRENIMDQVPNVIDVTTLLTPKGEYVRQFWAADR